MKRFQARRGNGRFTKNTMENTFGLHCAGCPHADCRRLNPSRVGEPAPTTCHACGRSLIAEESAPGWDADMQTLDDEHGEGRDPWVDGGLHTVRGRW